MQPGLIALLVVTLALGALGYRLAVERGSSGTGLKLAFVFAFFVLGPLLAVALWQQSKAKERLEAVGIAPHPAIRHALGMAVGIGKQPTWLFATREGSSPNLDWYVDAATRGAWRLERRSATRLTLRREAQRMTIRVSESAAAGRGTIAYLLGPATEQSAPQPAAGGGADAGAADPGAEDLAAHEAQ